VSIYPPITNYDVSYEIDYRGYLIIEETGTGKGLVNPLFRSMNFGGIGGNSWFVDMTDYYGIATAIPYQTVGIDIPYTTDKNFKFRKTDIVESNKNSEYNPKLLGSDYFNLRISDQTENGFDYDLQKLNKSNIKLRYTEALTPDISKKYIRVVDVDGVYINETSENLTGFIGSNDTTIAMPTTQYQSMLANNKNFFLQNSINRGMDIARAAPGIASSIATKNVVGAATQMFNVGLNYAQSRINENLTVDVIKLDADFDNTINLLINSDSKNETYKLFNVSVTDLDGFLADFNVPYVIKNIDGDVTVKFNFTSIKEEDVDILRKKFILKYIDQIYSTTDTSPENLLIQMLTLRDMKISVAESFTGGNLSAVLTSVSGASKVFYEGQVVYNENAKHERLNVDKVTLAEYKPVSKQVAYEMCRGLLNSGNCDVCISTTGIAGPKSDDSNFPVGLCYIGVGVYDKIKVYKYHFKGSRADITAQGVKTALCLAVKNLK
jgi:PncC family amidohydrolase